MAVSTTAALPCPTSSIFTRNPPTGRARSGPSNTTAQPSTPNVRAQPGNKGVQAASAKATAPAASSQPGAAGDQCTPGRLAHHSSATTGPQSRGHSVHPPRRDCCQRCRGPRHRLRHASGANTASGGAKARPTWPATPQYQHHGKNTGMAIAFTGKLTQAGRPTDKASNGASTSVTTPCSSRKPRKTAGIAEEALSLEGPAATAGPPSVDQMSAPRHQTTTRNPARPQRTGPATARLPARQPRHRQSCRAAAGRGPPCQAPASTPCAAPANCPRPARHNRMPPTRPTRPPPHLARRRRQPPAPFHPTHAHQHQPREQGDMQPRNGHQVRNAREGGRVSQAIACQASVRTDMLPARLSDGRR